MSRCQEATKQELEDTLKHLEAVQKKFHCHRMTKPEIIMKDWSELTDDDMERIANGGYEPDSHEKLWFDQDKAYTSLYFMNMKLPDNAMEDAVSRLMSDSKCGRIFRVKGFMQNAEGKWLELNATHKNITVKPKERGQAVFIVIGEGLDKEHIDGYFVPVPFRQGGKIQYWEYDGGSLRKQMLKAPLKYTRISSKFTYARKHPIYKVYRPHTGVDYAAPKGTPVHAVADGVVTFKGWGGGGGNTLKIKHAGNLMTGYLHLSGYAKGISKGSRVSQGQLIGYVGSTGASTGPHLDYRIWKNGTPINPLKIPQEPAEPISKENRATFEFVRDRIVAELNGEVKEGERITQLDSLVIPQPAAPVAAK